MLEKYIINTTLDNYYENPINKIIINLFTNIKQNFNPLLFTLIVNNNKDKLISALQNKTNNINIQDKDGDTPLHIAVFLCNYQIIKILLDNGAIINIKDKWGQTAIHRLYFGIKDKQIIKIIDFLDKKNGNFSAVDNFGNTVLHIALKQIIKLEIKLTDEHIIFINKLRFLISNDIKNNENLSIKDLLYIINYHF